MSQVKESHADCWEPEVYSFKGNQVLKIPLGDGYSMSFGVRKAEAILESLKAIQAFVLNNGKSCEVEEEKKPQKKDAWYKPGTDPKPPSSEDDDVPF